MDIAYHHMDILYRETISRATTEAVEGQTSRVQEDVGQCKTGIWMQQSEVLEQPWGTALHSDINGGLH